MEQAISPLSMTEGTVITPAGPEPGLRDVDQNISLVFYKSTSVRSARCCRIQQGKPCFFRLRLRSSSHVPSNHAVYEKYFRQVESGNTGRVLAADAAQFLKKSGLADLILGKIWDLADKESKGYLNKQEFFAALQLVACAQNGMEVSLSSLKAVVPPPKFHDNESPLLVGPAVSADVPWSVKVEEKSKYDAIFDSLIPANGFLSGDKVKPVLLNSKLSVEVLGRVWELSDIDRDGLLDRDEFAVAMFLVYSALEKEPVPMSLPPALVPPSKRKPIQSAASPPIIPPLPMPPSKEPRHSLPPVGILPTKAPAAQWVVSNTEKTKYDDIFQKLDKDMDGLVSGVEVREIFLKTGLPSGLLAHIWALCDTKDCGKLTKEQFALAFHFISHKLVTGVDPPHVLTPEMIPPSERLAAATVPAAPSPVADFSAIKELDHLNNEIVDLQKEKSNVEQELNEKEEAVKQRTGEIQDLQDEVERESANLQKLQAHKQEVQEVLEGLDEQKAKLEQQLQDLRLKCEEENRQIQGKLQELEDENTENHVGDHLSWRNHLNLPLVNGTADNASLSNSSSEPTNLYESAGEESPAQQEHQSHDSPVRRSPEITQNSGSDVEDKEKKTNVPPISDKVTFSVDPFDANQNTSLPPSVQESGLDFFQSDPFVDSDPFKDDPFGKIDPFGGDPFKDSDPFASDDFFKPSSADPFTSSKGDPFTSSRADPFTSTASPFTSTASPSSFPSGAVVKKNDPFAPGGIVVSPANDSVTEDPFASVFGNETLESGFADFSTLSKVTSSTDAFDATITSTDKEVVLSKNLFPDESSQLEDVPPALPPKTGTPTRPCPPPPERRPSSRSAESSDSLRHSDSFKQFNSLFSDSDVDPFTFSKGTEKAKSVRFNTVSTNSSTTQSQSGL
ncbi:epidermal growth factor receptor substrate 15 isoform X1 [Pelobates cultripes]|uniref:Epidermal growth factor receptor substrate 15 isoform X1 n=1 Tax=Pelobates cultripes TaxID=61616 RepID=A0AAD1STE6_PELCU|nr:epidermal growth factor receptor substrate 15 isoform X1 [Pelobates cultripes]